MRKLFSLFAGLLLAMALFAGAAMATDLIQIEPEVDKPTPPPKAPVITPAPKPTKAPKPGKAEPTPTVAPTEDSNVSFVPSQRPQRSNNSGNAGSNSSGTSAASNQTQQSTANTGANQAAQVVVVEPTMPPVLYVTDPVTGEIVYDPVTGEPTPLEGEELEAALAQWEQQTESYRQSQRQEVEIQLQQDLYAAGLNSPEFGLEGDPVVDELGIPEEEINAMDLTDDVMRSLRIKSSLPIGSVVHVGDECELTAVPMGFGEVNFRIQWQMAAKDAEGNLSEFHNIAGAHGAKYLIQFTEENIANHWRAVIKVVD